MTYGIIVVIHAIVCAVLIFLILVQAGKGGGLIESFSSAEPMFGTKTSAFLTKATSFLAIAFFISCLSLAFLSIQQNKSVIERNLKTIEASQEEKQQVEKALEEAVGQAQELPEATQPSAEQ